MSTRAALSDRYHIRARRARAHRAMPRRHHDAPPIASKHVSGREQWTRDLNEEGIEPHPGPRYLSKNIDGLNDIRKLEKTFKTIRTAHLIKPIQAVFLQEHNLRLDAADVASKMAREWDLLLFAAPLRNSGKGGTAIVIPADALECKANEDFSHALKRVRDTVRTLPSGRGIAIDTTVEGSPVRLASAYAYADTHAHQRPNFFSNTLRQLMNKHTVLGIDANCVPNERLDLKRTSQSPYNNTGATELNQLMADYQLIDHRRHTQKPRGRSLLHVTPQRTRGEHHEHTN